MKAILSMMAGGAPPDTEISARGGTGSPCFVRGSNLSPMLSTRLAPSYQILFGVPSDVPVGIASHSGPIELWFEPHGPQHSAKRRYTMMERVASERGGGGGIFDLSLIHI